VCLLRCETCTLYICFSTLTDVAAVGRNDSNEIMNLVSPTTSGLVYNASLCFLLVCCRGEYLYNFFVVS